MYKVKVKEYEAEFSNLDLAMSHAKELNVCVTIVGNGMEIVGLFGATGVTDGKTPDGHDYTWMKRRTQ